MICIGKTKCTSETGLLCTLIPFYWSNFNPHAVDFSIDQAQVFVFVDKVDAENSRESRSSQAKNYNLFYI